MKFSTNLLILIKATEKVGPMLARDFGELENLQANPTAAIRFVNAGYRKAKKILIEDLSAMRPKFELVFLGESLDENKAADPYESTIEKNKDYQLVALPIDGMENLARGIPHFTTSIALLYKNEPIVAVINDVASNAIYYCEKGMGAYVRNRRLRVSTRKIDQNPSAISDKFDANLATKFALKNFDCVTQSITYLAAAKVDLLEINDYKKYEPFLLLAQEAGAFVKKSEQKITLTNQVLHDSL